MANYPKNLILFLYNDNVIQDYLNEDNFEQQFNVLCNEAKVKEEQKQIIISRFRDKKSLQTIGNEIGMTREGVRVAQKSALLKLQQTLFKNINVAIYPQSFIEDLSISDKAARKLHNVGIHTVEDFISKDLNFFFNLKSVGVGILPEIIFAFFQAKFSLVSADNIKESIKNLCYKFKIKAKDVEPFLKDIINEEEIRYNNEVE